MDWNASNYRARKAKRLAEVKPEWVENPETGEKFYLRKVGAMAAMVAGHIPSGLTVEAVAAWREKGVEGVSSPKITQQQVGEAERDMQLIGRVVAQACVIPKLVQPATKEDELDPADLDDKDLMFIFRYATGQVGTVGLKGGQVMDMADLKSLAKKPGRRSRVGPDSPQLQQVS